MYPTLASAQQQKPDWAFPVPDKVKVEQRFAPDRLRTVASVSYTRAAVDDFYNVPVWRPQMHPQMSKVVQHGNKDTQVRACGSCHLPTGTGHDESAYMAGLPVNYFIRTMNDWKTGDRKYGGTMIAMLKIISDAEIREAAEYFAALKPTPWIRVVETDTVPKTYTARPPGASCIRTAAPSRSATASSSCLRTRGGGRSRSHLGLCRLCAEGQHRAGQGLVTTGGGKTLPCRICHGPTQRGLGDVPGIAGQHPDYIVRQLWNMQNGDRAGTYAALMKQWSTSSPSTTCWRSRAFVASMAP